MASITICSDFGGQKNKVSHCCHFSPSICYEVVVPDAMILVFWMLSFKPTFSFSSFTFTFCHKSGVICISEVTEISPGNLDSSLCFLQPSISHNVLCIKVKYAEWQYTALRCSFSYLEPVCFSMSSSNCCFLTCIQISQDYTGRCWVCLCNLYVFWFCFYLFIYLFFVYFEIISKFFEDT